MKWILPKDKQNWIAYLDACRNKRNETEYDLTGGINADEAEELVHFVDELKSFTLSFLKDQM